MTRRRSDEPSLWLQVRRHADCEETAAKMTASESSWCSLSKRRQDRQTDARERKERKEREREEAERD